MRGALHPLPQYVFIAWCSVKHRDDLSYFLQRCWITHQPPLQQLIC